ncbi:hypothetical protein PF003_g18782 [Phytophthora fragariae]|nr:hypothetical protein PF003_g18782 [Phytophthora fragariae]
MSRTLFASTRTRSRASENATVVDLAATVNATDHAPAEKSPAKNERGGPRRD